MSFVGLLLARTGIGVEAAAAIRSGGAAEGSARHHGA